MYPDWGTMRVRLTPVSGQMFGRSGFYLHNSHKGFSHGCIEVGSGPSSTDFFSALVQYALSPSQGRNMLTLGVKYTYPDPDSRQATPNGQIRNAVWGADHPGNGTFYFEGRLIAVFQCSTLSKPTRSRVGHCQFRYQYRRWACTRTTPRSVRPAPRVE